MKYVVTMLICFMFSLKVYAQEKRKADMYLTAMDQKEKFIGEVLFLDTPKGLLIKVDLKNLPQGQHGFHVHEFPNCLSKLDADGKHQPASLAGGHYDPYNTGKHLGPNGGGHLGDLPFLSVSKDGKVRTQFYLKDIKTNDFNNRSLMIHAGGDNYQDQPLPLGGGGIRIACGIIQ